MSLEARIRDLEERAARVAADVTAGAVAVPDDALARDYADRLAARMSELPQPAEPTARALVLTILADEDALAMANGLARRMAVIRDGQGVHGRYV